MSLLVEVPAHQGAQSQISDMLFSQTCAITSPKNETRRGILDQTCHTTSGLILFKGPRISGRASYAPPAKCAMISAAP